MQKWHGTGDTITRDMTRTIWWKKSGKDEHSGRDAGRDLNAKMA
jgi:hypothetical protein